MVLHRSDVAQHIIILFAVIIWCEEMLLLLLDFMLLKIVEVKTNIASFLQKYRRVKKPDRYQKINLLLVALNILP